MKVAVLGIGSVRCGAPIIGSLANYFGERQLEITFWDSDPERLDLFDRFARLCFKMTKATHSLVSTEDPAEALEGCKGVVLAIGPNCARRYLKQQGSLVGHGETEAVLVRRCASELLQMADLEASVLSLVKVDPDGRLWISAPWPAAPDERDRRALPHQILRYLNGDDYAHAFLRESVHSPVTAWLDGLTAGSEGI